jgi:hypothetical protein
MQVARMSVSDIRDRCSPGAPAYRFAHAGYDLQHPWDAEPFADGSDISDGRREPRPAVVIKAEIA